MKKGKTNIEMLCQGIEHIARNHGFDYDVDYEENGEVCIYGGCNVPTSCDVRQLCSDVKIDEDFIEEHEYGIDVWISEEWIELVGEYECTNCKYLWKIQLKQQFPSEMSVLK